MHLKPLLSTRPPQFALFDAVSLYWHGENIATVVVGRWYNLDSAVWFYALAGRDGLYPADVLTLNLARSEF